MRVRRAVALLLLALALPGSAQWLAGHRRLGRAVLVGVAAVTGLALLLGIVALADTGAVLGLFTDSTVLRLLAVLLVLLGLGQAALLADAWRLGRPATLPRRARPAVAAATALAVLLVTAGAVAGARRAWRERPCSTTSSTTVRRRPRSTAGTPYSCWVATPAPTGSVRGPTA